ncbi:MAG TPA: hypothetical protein VGQ62_10410 [Chloroflexota bacterium]|jgi:hypothetical protein|nr:hypothetical protein [Chloroflexota bacterium]
MFWRSSLLTLALLSLQLSPVRAQAAPGLPTHFGFGLSAGQGDTWMPQSAIGWDYRFQYLVGGVNTNQGWETWNPNGTFALNYAQESQQHGYIPMFPYYELLQSNGSCGNCDENRKDLTNLNDAGLMHAYFDNFALLMKRLGPGTYDGIKGFGSTALINVEADFSGGYAMQAANRGVCFNFCTGRGNEPTLVKASVASSGFADVAGFPDTYTGYTQALAHLRDLYAPNVLLGYDVSTFATGVDLGLDTNPNLDGAALGNEVGVFMSKLGPHEVLFHNPLDRDAGQYKALFGQNRWWDRLNQTFPNFTRWQQYLHATVVADGNKPMLLWQVPAGNQYFQTVNNTNGHFQDNRAEYIFSHVPELIQTGIVGVMFSPGNAGGTTWGDTIKDGITNPPVICTSDGLSSGQICNNHESTVADDDGGYIRMSGQAYYQSPVALSGAAALTGSASPVAAPVHVELMGAGVDPGDGIGGQEIVFHQELTVSTDANVLVDFELYDNRGQRVWQVWHDNLQFQGGAVSSDIAVFTIPDSLPAGQYTLKAGVFSAGWGTQYAWNDNAGKLTVGGGAA